MLRRVLIPSDQRDWVVHFAEAYRRLGFDVTTGTYNFDLEASHPDLIHFVWPEELAGWTRPDFRKIDSMTACLDRWVHRARCIFTVSNLYPHGQYRDPIWHRLYSAFFERAEVIHHFSQASLDQVRKEYPAAAGRNHLVRVGYNYELFLPRRPRERAKSRSKFGFEPSDVVYLVFGSLRFWREAALIRRAFGRVNVPRKKLLMAARYVEPGSSWRLRWRRLQWKRWLCSKGTVAFTSYIPNEELCDLFDAADVLVVVREDCLSSGVPSLGMTFGRMVVAPSVGCIPEFLADTDNLLYEPNSASGLALAMERAVAMNREAIGAKNRDIAARWDWEGIIRCCLDALPPARG